MGTTISPGAVLPTFSCLVLMLHTCVALNSPPTQGGTGMVASARVPTTRMATFEETSPFVKSLVGGLTAVTNVVFPPRRLSPAEAEALAARAASRRAAAPITPAELAAGLADDFARQYLFSGQIDPNLYDDECVFTDPTLSFRGLATFERNLASLRPVLDTLLGETSVELFSLEVQEDTSCVVATWRMAGGIRLPWRPRIELRGCTQYTYDASRKGRIVRYDEFWLSSAADQLLALFRPGATTTLPLK